MSAGTRGAYTRLMTRLGAVFGLLLTGCASVLGADFDDLKPLDDGGGAVGATGTGAAGGGGGDGGGGASAGGGGAGGDAPIGPALPLVCGDMSGLEPGAPWPMAGYCPTRQARAGAASFSSPSERWTATLEAGIFTEPIVAADGAVYVVTYDVTTPLESAELWRVERGVPQWSLDVTSLTAPAIGADGRLVLLDGTSVRWVLPSGDESGPPTSLGAPVYGSPVIGAGGRIYAPTSQGLYAVSAGGAVEWFAPTPENLRTPVALGLDGTAYVGSVTGTLYAIDSDGSIQWDFPTGETTEDMPVFVDTDTILFTTFERVYAVDASGDEKWSFSTGPYPTITPVPFGDVTYVVSIDGMNAMTLWSLDDFGIPAWSIPSVGNMGRPALSVDGLLASFVAYQPGSINPRVVARHPADGEEYWSIEDPFKSATAYPPAAWGNDGTLYVAVVDRLHAIGP